MTRTELIFTRLYLFGMALAVGFFIVVSGREWAMPEALAVGSEVTLLRTPDDGIQPQADVDDNGVVHLIYFKGDPMAGDIYYVRRTPGETSFSTPFRVNSQSGSAIATGSVRGAHLAIGKDGRVHVSWMGSKLAEPKGPSNSTPMLYTRLNLEKTGFEPQRNIMRFASGLDGGGSVAADTRGNVYVAWHARGDREGEMNRRVYVARSENEGKSFDREFAAFSEPTGACGCCGMRAFVDHSGNVYLIYRAATESVNRDIELLVSTDRGRSFKGIRLHRWNLQSCPMSTISLKATAGRVLAAWETEGQVYYAPVSPDLRTIPGPVVAPGDGGTRKHPVAISSRGGKTLLVWTEGMGWNRGGLLAWQLFDNVGNPLGAKGEIAGVPVWSFPTAFETPNGDLTIIY